MKKILFLLCLLFVPAFVLADGPAMDSDETFKSGTIETETIFKAKVIEVVEEIENVMPDGEKVLQQNLKLKGLSGDFTDKEVLFEGIGSFSLINSKQYKIGEKVLVVESLDENGEANYYITDYIRNNVIYALFGIFALSMLIIGGKKGLRSIISLVLTFLVIIKFIIPKLIGGEAILFPVLLGSFLILVIIIYFTEGFKSRSHISIISTAFILLVTVLLSWIFIELAKISGVASEEVAYLVNVGNGAINFKGLLLAGMIIGAVGVMDDVIISQVTSVEQIYKTDPSQSFGEVFKKAYDIGLSHISSMTNTLFLAYAGASLPLLVLFSSGQSAFHSFSDIINNEMLATEIIRTLSGSIGLIFAVPLSTFLACWWFKKYKK